MASVLCVNAGGHGGVFMEDDQCVIQIDFFQAHFTAYQPQTQANEEFCEDLPDVTETVFVLDYLHNSLKDMPVDFRIIRDTTSLGQFAKWEDVAQLENLERDTVFYQSPVKRPNAVFTVEHTFEKAGHYIGIITTTNPRGRSKTYRAVFPFEVGGTGFGYWPILVGLALLLQVNYWVMSGGYSKWRARRTASNTLDN